MGTFARALEIAHKLVEDKALSQPLRSRYAGNSRGMGKKALQRKTNLAQLEDCAVAKGEPEARSGSQEILENMLNRYTLRAAK